MLKTIFHFESVIYLPFQNVLILRQVVIHQEAYRVEAVDTTAAGDTFTGFYLASILRGEEVNTALRIAAKASSITVTKEGAAKSIPTLEQVVESMKNV